MNVALRTWLLWGHAIRRYHRYEVRGLEHLDGPGSKLIVGYHGRGFAHDLIALNAQLHQRHGHIPISVVHAAFDQPGTFSHEFFIEGLGFVTEDSPQMGAAIAAGRHILVAPGGVREANRSFRVRYRVDWGRRTGFVRLALRYGLPIVPVAASGTDDTYIGLNDGYAWGKALGRAHAKPLWIGLGPLGICPLSPPFPTKLRQLIGPPIDLRGEGPFAFGAFEDLDDPATRERLVAMSVRIQAQVQRLLDHARATR